MVKKIINFFIFNEEYKRFCKLRECLDENF